MEYEDLIKVSKRYLFNEKMSVLFHHSCLLIDNRHFKLELNDKFAYPWELETIFLFFVVSQEKGTSDFKGKNYKQFNKILDCVRNYDNKKLDIISNENLLRDFLLLNAPSQFEVQESYIYRMFRFNYIFNFKNDNINMKEIFIKKFGISP